MPLAPGPIGYRHDSSGGAVGHVVSYIAHAAIWKAAGRFMYHLPLSVVLLVAVIAAAWLIHSRRRRS